jgi:hypothetical protein
VLATDVEIVDIDGRHWANWLSLLAPPGVLDDPSWAVVFIDGTNVVKAAVRGIGDINPADIPFTGTSRNQVEALRVALGVGAVAVLETDTISKIYRDMESHLEIGDDIVAQGLTILRSLKKANGKGLWLEPHILDLVPVPSYEALQRTFDLLISNGSSMLAYIIDDDKSSVYTSIIAVKRDGNIDAVSTHLGIADQLGEQVFARDWRKQYKRLLKLVDSRFAKPSVAVFLERDTFYRILTGPTDQLAREINARNVIIDPAPAWLLGLLSGATVAAFATRGAKALARVMPSQARKLAAEWAEGAKQVLKDSGASPFGLLGFDPIELWMSLRRFYRRPDPRP